MASTDDFTAFTLVRREAEDDGQSFSSSEPEDRHHVKVWYWVPEQKIKDLEADGKHLYRQWANAGLIRVVPGPALDTAYVRRDVADLLNEYGIADIGYDDWNAYEIAMRLQEDHGVTMVDLRQGYKTLSEPTKKLERLLKLGKVNHGGDPVLRWMFQNVQIKTDENGNIRPVKPKHGSDKKVDGILSTVFAVQRALKSDGPAKTSIYETQGIAHV